MLLVIANGHSLTHSLVAMAMAMATHLSIHSSPVCAFRPIPFRASGLAASDSLKSPAEEDWRIKRQTLLKNKVRSVDVNEARRLQQDEGYTLLDVRPKRDYGEVHPPGAVNVEVYRLIKEWTPWDVARRIGFAFFGIFQGTEENPDFLKDVGSKVTKDSPLIVACAMGGSLKSTPSLLEGKESRSLIAAYLLILEGYTKILHLEGGVQAWFREGLPVEVESQ